MEYNSDKYYSKSDIISLCADWIVCFKAVHEYIESYIKTNPDTYRGVFNVGESSAKNQDNTRSLSLSLETIGEDSATINEGAVLELNIENEDLFKFLFAYVFNYYLDKNFKYINLNPNEIDIIPSLADVSIDTSKFITANLKEIIGKDSEYKTLIESIIIKHNLGIYPAEELDSLFARFKDQVIVGDKLQKSLDRTDSNLGELIQGREKIGER